MSIHFDPESARFAFFLRMTDQDATLQPLKTVNRVVDRRTVEIPDEQVHARLTFGAATRNWFQLNRWSQDVPHYFAKQRGLNGPWNSQVSLMQNGKLDPKPQYWLSLEAFNLCVAEADFEGLEDPLIKRLVDKKAFNTDKGEPAKAEHFFMMFIGRASWDPLFSSRPRLTEEEAESRGRGIKKRFEAVMLDQMLSRQELWREITNDPHFNAAVDEQGLDVRLLQRWLVGIDLYSPELHQDFGDHLEGLLARMKAE